MFQTLGSMNRIGSPTSSQKQVLASAGTNQATAAQIANYGGVVEVSGADGTKAVKLPPARQGAVLYVYSTVAANGLPVFPATGDDINDGTANAAVTIEGRTLAIFIGLDNTTWAAMFTANT